MFEKEQPLRQATWVKTCPTGVKEGRKKRNHANFILPANNGKEYRKKTATASL